MSKNKRPYRSPGKRLPIFNGMSVAKIKNSYFFPDSNNPRGHHYYLIYHDKKSGKNLAVATTHLYNIDRRRFHALSNGEGIKVHLPGLDTPSMVKKKVYSIDSKGRPVDFSNSAVMVRASLSRSKTNRVIRFVRSFYK